MQGVKTFAGGCVFVERNKYAPWGCGVREITSPRPAPYVWRKGNGKLADADIGRPVRPHRSGGGS